MGYIGNIKSLGGQRPFNGNPNFLGNVGTSDTYIIASGGVETRNGNWLRYTFASSGNWTVTALSNNAAYNLIKVLCVAGGGGGGGEIGVGGGGSGGGSGGQVVENLSFLLTSTGIFPCVVGSGGIGNIGRTGTPTAGSNSTFSTITAIGGGRAGSFNGAAQNGGGGFWSVNSSGATNTMGYTGGNGGNDSGGGGAGAGQNGGATSAPGSGGNGGNGYTSAITGSVYGGGGAGGSFVKTTASVGGTGGGGNGAYFLSGEQNGQNGTTNTGGGGGGAVGRIVTGTGGNGGSGIIIIEIFSPL